MTADLDQAGGGGFVEAGSTALDPRTRAHFFALGYVLLGLLCLPFAGAARAAGGTLPFAAALLVTYPAMYLAPTWLLSWLAARVSARLAAIVSVVSLGATALLLILDAGVHDIYGFHLNGFVWNLVTTRGGLASMGLSGSAEATAVAAVLAFFLLAGGLFRVAGWIARREPRAARRPAYGRWVLVLLAVSCVERLGFGLADLRHDGTVQAAAACFPLYNGSTFEGLATRLGLEVEPRRVADVSGGTGTLRYPRSELDLAPPEHPLNIVWLVAESWRFDTLDPEIMPRTWDFAGRAQRFTHHLSGGNGTRMGVFSMFYGLYAPYWFDALHANRGPVLIDAVLAQGYQTRMFTSAHFTYPEFDRTVFARIPSGQLVEDSGGKGWERDRRNVNNLLEFIDGRDRERPFMTFLFFESPHARYYFPEESVIREPYLEDFNYATMNLERDIDLIHNRYLNSCHHLDGQFGRILDHLEDAGLLDDTIVVLTGDHGEEFMERGRWGHGSTFVDQQVHVPLVLWIPGQEPAVVDRLTSHLDLPATLLPRLGVQNPPEELSYGLDLTRPLEREFAVLGDWSRLCYVDRDYKVGFPIKAAGLLRSEATGDDDSPLPDGVDVWSERGEALGGLLRDLGRFRTGARTAPE